MKKSVLSFILTVALVAAVPMGASAETISGSENWEVSFNGKGMESNFDNTDLDDVIYEMQPGDTAEMQIHLTNKHKKESDWYMSNEIVQSMEDSTAASGGAYAYLLTYTGGDGKETVIFDSDSVGGDDVKEGEGLHKVSESLGETFYLGRLTSGASGVVGLKVTLDGETFGNEYQTQLAKMDMQFAAEEAPEDQIVTTEVTKQPGDGAVIIKTGDDSNVMLYVSLAALAVGLILIILAVKKRQKEDRKNENKK